MQTASINGVNLQFEVQGLGEPVVLVHGSILADGLAPLLKAPILTQHYRIIRYYRCGFDGSTYLTPPVSIAQQAKHCRALLRYLNIERAHIVGYDYGRLIALQLASMLLKLSIHSPSWSRRWCWGMVFPVVASL